MYAHVLPLRLRRRHYSLEYIYSISFGEYYESKDGRVRTERKGLYNKYSRSAASAPQSAPWTDQYTAELGGWYFRAKDRNLHKPQRINESGRLDQQIQSNNPSASPCAPSPTKRWDCALCLNGDSD